AGVSAGADPVPEALEPGGRLRAGDPDARETLPLRFLAENPGLLDSIRPRLHARRAIVAPGDMIPEGSGARAAGGIPTSNDRFYPRVFGLVVAALLAVAMVAILTPFVGPILW